MKANFIILDEIRVTHRDKDGKVLSDKKINTRFFHRLLRKLGLVHDSITNDGFAQVAAFILSDIDADHSVFKNCDWIAIGTGTTAADPTDYNLETLKSILAAVGTRVQTTVTNDTAQLVITFSQAADPGLTGVDAITEIGVFWDDTPDDHSMLLRQVYSPVDNCDWDAGDTLQVTVKVQIKQGT